MFRTIQQQYTNLVYRILCGFVAFSFFFTSIIPPSQVQAQVVLQPVFNLPAVGSMLGLTSSFNPPIINGVNIHLDDPLKFDFIIDRGDDNLSGQDFEKESQKLIKYFLAALTVPEEEMWVNLSPYEKNRIIPDSFGNTEMGRDLLAQDYLLKQLTASLMYPEEELGKIFWDKIYKRAYEEYGTSEIPMDTFNKVWIMPESATVYEHEKGAYVVSSHLKVMLEEDYWAREGSFVKREVSDSRGAIYDSQVSKEIIKQIIIPAIEQEVNEGKTFANLRQIYNSVILATWYKKELKDSLLGQVYVDQNKTKGVDIDDPNVNQQIYDQYVEAFKMGAYNYIKEDYDPATQEMIPRKYFSGGVQLEIPINQTAASPIILKEIKAAEKNSDIVTASLDPYRSESTSSPVSQQRAYNKGKRRDGKSERPKNDVLYKRSVKDKKRKDSRNKSEDHWKRVLDSVGRVKTTSSPVRINDVNSDQNRLMEGVFLPIIEEHAKSVYKQVSEFLEDKKEQILRDYKENNKEALTKWTEVLSRQFYYLPSRIGDGQSGEKVVVFYLRKQFENKNSVIDKIGLGFADFINRMNFEENIKFPSLDIKVPEEINYQRMGKFVELLVQEEIKKGSTFTKVARDIKIEFLTLKKIIAGKKITRNILLNYLKVSNFFNVELMDMIDGRQINKKIFREYDIKDLFSGQRLAQNIKNIKTAQRNKIIPKGKKVMFSSVQSGAYSPSLEEFLKMAAILKINPEGLLRQGVYLDAMIPEVSKRGAFSFLPDQMVQDIKMQIGNRLRQLRDLKDKSIQQAALEIGLNKKELSSLEKGLSKRMQVQSFVKIIDYYGVSFFYILTGKTIRGKLFEAVNKELLLERFLNNLYELRKAKYQYAADFARAIDVSPSEYREHESGEVFPLMENFIKFSKGLKIFPELLIGKEEETLRFIAENRQERMKNLIRNWIYREQEPSFFPGDIDYQSMGHRIQALMDLFAFTQEDIHQGTGIPKSTISELINGHLKNMTVYSIKDIADYFGVSMLFLITGYEIKGRLMFGDKFSEKNDLKGNVELAAILSGRSVKGFRTAFKFNNFVRIVKKLKVPSDRLLGAKEDVVGYWTDVLRKLNGSGSGYISTNELSVFLVVIDGLVKGKKRIVIVGDEVRRLRQLQDNVNVLVSYLEKMFVDDIHKDLIQKPIEEHEEIISKLKQNGHGFLTDQEADLIWTYVTESELKEDLTKSEVTEIKEGFDVKLHSLLRVQQFLNRLNIRYDGNGGNGIVTLRNSVGKVKTSSPVVEKQEVVTILNSLEEEHDEDSDESIFELLGIDAEYLVELPSKIELNNLKKETSIKRVFLMGRGGLGVPNDKSQYYSYEYILDGASVGGLKFLVYQDTIFIKNHSIEKSLREKGVGSTGINWLASIAKKNNRKLAGETISLSELRALQKVLVNVEINDRVLTSEDVRNDPYVLSLINGGEEVRIVGDPSPMEIQEATSSPISDDLLEVQYKGKSFSPVVSLSDERSLSPKSLELSAGGEKGGIDLDPNAIDMKIEQKDGIGFNFPAPTPAQIKEFQNIQGFVPIIINIAPAVNLPMLLGLDDSEEGDGSMSLTYRNDPINHKNRFAIKEESSLSHLN